MAVMLSWLSFTLVARSASIDTTQSVYFCDGLDTIMVEPEGGKYHGYAYWFKKDSYVKYDAVNNKPVAGYPAKISGGWKGLPSDIDASFADAASKNAFFFKGNQVYKWDATSDTLVKGYPQAISDEFPGLPADWLNSGVNNVYTETLKGKRFGKVYFMKGSKYMAYNVSTRKPSSDVGEIKDLIPGMPTGDIDAVLVEPIHARLSNNIYFFKGSQYYMWDMTSEKCIHEGHPTSIHSGWDMTCAPPAMPPQPLNWECHSDKKSTLSRDLIISDTLYFDNITWCLGNCTLLGRLGTDVCVSVNWHETNHECHAKIGQYTHDEFMTSLNADTDWTSCYGSPQNTTIVV